MKKKLSLIGAICAIFAGGLSMISFFRWALLGVDVGILGRSFIFNFPLDFLMFIFGVIVLIKRNKELANHKRSDIALVVISGVFFIASVAFGVHGFLAFLIFASGLASLGLRIAVLCMKDDEVKKASYFETTEKDYQEEVKSSVSNDKVFTSSNISPEVQAKLNSLKQRKAIGLINEEQYNAAVQKILNG